MIQQRLDDKELQIQECTVQEVKASDFISEDKAQERCMVSFRPLHSHIKLLSNNDLKGTRTEYGFKRAFATLFGQDVETFTGTMFLNMDQLEKQLNNEEFQEIGSMVAFKIPEFSDTLIQHMESVKKSIDKRALHKRDGTESKEQNTSSISGNDAHADDADIRPIYDEELMAEKCIFNANHDSCVTKFLKEVNLRAKVPSNKTTNKNKPVEQISVAKKQERQIPKGHRFSIKNTFVMHEKTMTPRSCLRWKPTGKIFKTVGLRWVLTRKIFASSTTKVDSEPINGSDEDITNQYEYEQTLDVSIEHPSDTYVFTVKMKILLEPTSKKLSVGSKRRNLWRDLINDSRYVNGKPWCIVKDMNVTLHPNEHSCRASVMSMVEFQNCLNDIKVEDICSSGLQFTWTKNLHKAKLGIMTGILKKLDRIMSNEDFIKQFPQAHAKKLNQVRICLKNLSAEDAGKMIADIYAEIKRALFDIDDTKDPNRDRFTSALFKKSWSIVGADTYRAIIEFFVIGKMLGEMNATLVSLIPKIQTPNKVTDFKPIAYCNVLYNCISRVLTNKIKPSLGNLVSYNQSAFIPRSHIHDNILLTQEFMRGYNRKGGPKRVVIKTAIQKAYDTYVSTAAFTLNVNGDRVGYFKGGRGLRKGDPISPYLFTLIMEVFFFGKGFQYLELLKADNTVRVNQIVTFFLIESSIHLLDHYRYPVTTSSVHIESRKSPTKSLFDVGSRRISIFIVNT
nr:hypothetical protein [Tanacetum cinerariifolium]